MTSAQRVDVLPQQPVAGEFAVGILTALYVTLAGAAAGLVWAAVAPKLSKPALLSLSGAMFHPQVGADAWFLVVGGVAGILCTLAATLAFGEPGPGMVGGLAIGGLAAALVADRVGYLAELDGNTKMAIAAFRSIGLAPDITEIDFRIRSLGVLTVWPIASLAAVGLVMAINAARR